MDVETLIKSAVIAAVVSGVISIVGFLVNRSTSIAINREKIQADIDLAKKKFDYDRQQAIFKRRFELAEQFLADAYRFRDLVAFARNDVSRLGEGASRESVPDEPEGLKILRDAFFVPQERLNDENAFISEFSARQPSCVAHFGPRAEEAFKLMSQSISRVCMASSVAIKLSDSNNIDDINTVQAQMKDIWQKIDKIENGDHIGGDIQRAVEIIKDLCSPVLSWVDKAQ